MIATKEFIEDKILRSNRKYSALRVTDGDTVIDKYAIEKGIDTKHYRVELSNMISKCIDKYGPLQYLDEYYGKEDMCLLLGISGCKAAKLHAKPMLKCDRISYGEKCVVFDISQSIGETKKFPSMLSFAIAKEDLKKLIKTIMDGRE